MRFSIGMTAKTLIAAGVATALASSALAATQGTVGFTSTGTLNISIDIDDEMRISGLNDIVLGSFAGVDMTGSSGACIYRNSASTYRITATGDGLGGAFTLTDGTNTVPYSVDYTDELAGAEPMSSGTALTGQGGADDTVDCSNKTANENADIAVTVDAVDAAGLPAAAYTGTLTLVVAPN